MASSQGESPIDRSSAKIICVLGAPGVGKGTLCTRLATDLPGLVHISTGDLLRDPSSILPSSSTTTTSIQEHMKSATLVPYSFIRTVLDNYLASQVRKGQTMFLLDGFPRSAEQTAFFQEEKNWQVSAILHFYAPKPVLLARVLKRAKTSGRVDDTAEVFTKRLVAHEAEIKSVLGAFEGKVENVNCENDLDEIYKHLKPKVEEVFGIEGVED